jgi:hypothetical protein
MDEPKDAVDSENVQKDSSSTNPTINIEKLAEKVYQLMCADIRLAKARGNRRNKRR